MIGSDTKALVFCENGELCKTVKAKAGRPRDENRPCGWNAGGQVVQGFKCLGENKIHRWSEASMGVAVTTGSQLAVENPYLSFAGWRSGPDELALEVGGVVIWGSSPHYGPGSGEGFGGGAGRLQGNGNIIHGNPGVAVVMVC